MSVHKSGPWELTPEEVARYQEVLPKEEAVQFMLPGCGSPANKSYLEVCLHDIHNSPAHNIPIIHRKRRRMNPPWLDHRQDFV